MVISPASISNQLHILNDKPFDLHPKSVNESTYSNGNYVQSSSSIASSTDNVYKLLTEKIIFKEDDREDRPFLIVEEQ